MMGKKIENRTKRIILRLTAQEFKKLETNWKGSTCRNLSEYVRLVLFNKAVTTFYRNQSLDDLMSELIELKKDLAKVGINFNQAVKRLNNLENNSDLKTWLQVYELDKITLLSAVENINIHIQRSAEKWLQ